MKTSQHGILQNLFRYNVFRSRIIVKKKLPIIMFEFQNEFVRMSTNAVLFPPFDLLSLLQSIQQQLGFLVKCFFFILLRQQSPSRMDDLSRRHSFKITIYDIYILFTIYKFIYIASIRFCTVTNTNCDLPIKKKR